MSLIPHPLKIEQIEQTTSCNSISYFKTINSTNSYLLEQGRCGDICISEAQSAGRGRRGNNWVSPATGNLYFSMCWCFDGLSEYWSLLGLVIGIATSEALQDIGLNSHGVKWPNDIYWQQKKMGGILLETQDQTGKIIIGVGLNINMPDTANRQIEQPFASLVKALQNKLESREALVIALITRLKQHLKNFNQFNFDHFLESWKNWDILNNELVSFEHQGEIVSGRVIEIDKHGRLGILEESGKVSFFSSADIRLRGL